MKRGEENSMATHDFDVAILGGGNAAMGVTEPAAAAGLRVAMIEPWTLGGTCSNRGCTPKKILVAAAHALHDIEQASVHKISVSKPKLDWGALIAREKNMIGDLPGRFESLMAKRGVTLFREPGRFTGPNRITTGGNVLNAKHIVIATGSTHRSLPIPGAALMITSDDVLSETEQPKRVVFIGGGVIAFEFAHVYARAGTDVTILEAAPLFLSRFEQDAVNAVVDETKRIGVTALADVSVERIERAGDGLRVICRHNGREHEIDADRVVNGAGRVPNIEGLDLSAGSVDVEDGRILTDQPFRSASNPSVFAVGDALSGKAQLSPIATREGRIVGGIIAGGPPAYLDYGKIPAAVYTIPTLATVGLSETEAEAAGHTTRTHANDLSGWFSARTNADTAAFAKIVVDDESDRILGAHLVGHNAGDLIHVFALAMQHDIPAAAVKGMVYAFPTYAADVPSMM